LYSSVAEKQQEHDLFNPVANQKHLRWRSIYSPLKRKQLRK